MSAAQHKVLKQLGRHGKSVPVLAAELNSRPCSVQRVLDALYRRSLVTITPRGNWCATERGRGKVAA